MRVYKIEKKYLLQIFNELKKIGKIIAPISDDKSIVFDEVQNLAQVVLDYKKTLLPIRKILYPPKQELLSFNEELIINQNIQFTELSKPSQWTVLFGLHPCDLNAINIQDQFYLHGKFIDPFYKQIRENTFIVGHSCLPGDDCFCNNTNTDDINQGFDLFLNELDGQYLVWVGSTKGEDFVAKNYDHFSKTITQEDLDRFTEWNNYRRKMFKHKFGLHSMPKLMELSLGSNIWEELGEECLSCGLCTTVCPTCSCYNIKDELDAAEFGSGARYRYWDSCMLPIFSMVSSGYNFRENRSDRLKLYYTHKLKGYQGIFEQPSCVGCGRCIDACPVNINILRVVKELSRIEV